MPITECPECGGPVFKETISETLADFSHVSIEIDACRKCPWMTTIDWDRLSPHGNALRVADLVEKCMHFIYPNDFNEDTTVTLP